MRKKIPPFLNCFFVVVVVLLKIVFDFWMSPQLWLAPEHTDAHCIIQPQIALLKKNPAQHKHNNR